MHISAVEEYGLRCALQLASLEPGAVIAASQIAEREGISVQYASKIMHLFRKAGLVEAVRGMQGGFRLNDANIPLKSIFQALNEEKETKHFCGQFTGQQNECVHLNNCSVRPVWDTLSGFFDSVLEQITLADLAKGEQQSRAKAQFLAAAQADRIRKQFSSISIGSTQ